MKMIRRHYVNITILAAMVAVLAAGITTVRTASPVAPLNSPIVLAQAAAPAQAASKPQMADDVFKNVQVLKGIPVDDFMGTMGIMSASLSMCCEDCHSGAGDGQGQMGG